MNRWLVKTENSLLIAKLETCDAMPLAENVRKCIFTLAVAVRGKKGSEKNAQTASTKHNYSNWSQQSNSLSPFARYEVHSTLLPIKVFIGCTFSFFFVSFFFRFVLPRSFACHTHCMAESSSRIFIGSKKFLRRMQKLNENVIMPVCVCVYAVCCMHQQFLPNHIRMRKRWVRYGTLKQDRIFHFHCSPCMAPIFYHMYVCVYLFFKRYYYLCRLSIYSYVICII